MAIKELITLEGAEDVKASLEDLGKSGEQFIDSMNNLGGGATQGLNQVTVNVGRASQAFGEHARSAASVSETYHVMVPLLRSAGLGFENMRGWAALARGGIEGLGLAITGAAVVGLAKLEDAARTTQGQLEDLFGSKVLGATAFEGLKRAAADLGSTVANIAPGFEALVTAWNRFVESTRRFKFVAPTGGALPGLPPGMVGSVESLTAAWSNLFKLLRAGRLDASQAATAEQAFFTALQNGGKLTAEVLQKLPVGTIKLLAEALGRGTISAEAFVNQVKLAPIPMDRLVEALSRFGPQSQQAFDTKAVITFRDALAEIWTTLQQGFKGIAGIGFSDFVVTELRKIRIEVQATIDGIIAFRDWLQKPAGTGLLELNQRFKEIDEAAAKALQELVNLRTEEAKSPLIQAPTGVQAPPGSKTVPPPITAQDAEKVYQPLVSASENAATESAGFWQKTFDAVFGPGKFAEAQRYFDAIKADMLQISQMRVPGITAPTTPPPAPVAPELGGQATEQIVAPFAQAAQQIRDMWLELANRMGDPATYAAISQVTPILVAPFAEAVRQIRDTLLPIEQMIQEIIRQAQAAQRAVSGIGTPGPWGGGGSMIEVASGGLIRGRGTTTSDSIPAWLSNLEFVTRAKAVNYYGADFFQALNAMRIPRELLARNLALAAAPRFAEGGQVKPSMRPFVLNVSGMGAFQGQINAPDKVIAVLAKESVFEQLAAGGRSPGWRR